MSNICDLLWQPNMSIICRLVNEKQFKPVCAVWKIATQLYCNNYDVQNKMSKAVIRYSNRQLIRCLLFFDWLEFFCMTQNQMTTSDFSLKMSLRKKTVRRFTFRQICLFLVQKSLFEKPTMPQNTKASSMYLLELYLQGCIQS